MRRAVPSFVLIVILSAAGLAAVAATQQQAPSTAEPLHRPFDQILDLYVRDGLVYYGAIKSERGRLDRYVASLNVPAATYDRWTKPQQMAFWVNAYNAFVLQTVANHYPIRGRSAAYPSASIRQIPGAFDKIPHRAAGRSVTLDEIEKTLLPAFEEPRLYLALGRGAVGSGRLRSEAFSADTLERQLDAVQADFLRRKEMIRIDRTSDVISVTPILSWREAEFVAKYDPGATGPYAERSPLERALLAFIAPNLLPLEKEFVRRNEFRVVFHDFDWRLNDLTGGRVD
ncbi:MAG TPA: DUF547 domain-containing protein [Vicinamibacterales bacterium]|nr:DUF547 domain-containing protein [Vicinamibacterales bacterium]